MILFKFLNDKGQHIPKNTITQNSKTSNTGIPENNPLNIFPVTINVRVMNPNKYKIIFPAQNIYPFLPHNSLPNDSYSIYSLISNILS